MTITIDGIEFDKIKLTSIQRKRVNETGKNKGTFMSGGKFNDVRYSYYQYSLTVVPYLSHKDQYEELYTLLSLPLEAHTVTLPYGQGTVTFDAYVASVSDRLRKALPNGLIWESFSVTLKGTEPIQV